MAQKSVQKHVPIIADAHLFFNLLVSLGCNHRDDYSFFCSGHNNIRNQYESYIINNN